MAVHPAFTFLRVAAFGMGLGCTVVTPPAQAEPARPGVDTHPVATDFTRLADGDGGAPTRSTPQPQFG
jgi:hypothetical protein